MMAKLTLTDVHEVIATKYFYLSDEFIECSPFDSIEELQEIIM